MSGGPIAPDHRRLHLTLDLHADTLGELTSRLVNIATDLDLEGEGLRNRTSGGWSSSYHLTVEVDPEMDGERYRRELSAWHEHRHAERLAAKQ